MKKLLLILLCLPMIGFAQTQKNKSTFNFNKSNDYSKIYTYNNFKNENSEIKHNVCDSIIIINPDKQNKGEFMIDLRKVIKIYGSENTRWIYTYGDVASNEIYAKDFVPDTVVACVSIKEPVITCCSKWIWNGQVWDKQKEVTKEQFKSTLPLLKQ